MRALIQKVKESHVAIDGKRVSVISKGLLIFLGVAQNDTEEDARKLVEKIQNLRIFEHDMERSDPVDHGKMNFSLLDIKGEVLVISQFTLYADCKKGRRPSFTDAAPSEKANQLYEYFVSEFRKSGLRVETGVFQAMMDVSLVNLGPVTIMLDSKL